MSENHEESSLVEFAAALGVTVSRDDIFEDFECSPDYPSLLAVVSALEAWGISVDGLRMAPEHLVGVTGPIIFSLRSGALAFVPRLRHGHTVSLRHSGAQHTLPWATFLEQWDGVVLQPAPGKPVRPRTPRNAPDGPARQFRAAVAVAALVALIAAVGSTVLPSSAAVPLAGYALLALFGFGLAIGLAREELGIGSFMSALCRAGSTLNCQSVLSSRAAKLGPVSMADVGVAYFSGSLLALLTGAADSPWLTSALLLMSLAALPYTVFSVVYQGFIVRQWCPLCLMVQGVLLAQAAWLLAVGPSALLHPPSAGLVAFAVAFALPGAAWVLAKPGVRASLQAPALRAAYARLERNAGVIQALLNGADEEAGPEVKLEFKQGTDGAPLQVTAYTDPACPHCADLHEALEPLVRQYGSVCQVRWRYVDVLRAPNSTPFFQKLATTLVENNPAEGTRWATAWFSALRERQPPPTFAGPTTAAATALLREQAVLVSAQPLHRAPVVLVNGKLWPPALKYGALGALAAHLFRETDEATAADEAGEATARAILTNTAETG